MTEPALLTLTQLRAGLDRKDFSSVELTSSCLKLIEKHADLNAFIEICEEQALAQAKHADSLLAKGETSPLLGIPLAIKDAIVTAGIRTTCASKMLQNFIPPYDATVIQKLKQEGAVIVAKNNLDEFAMGSSSENSAFGPVKNPWDKKRVPGGSSSGSAAAVAAGLVPGALGTDTGGSVRQPASFCGIVGIKPTYGRVSRYGVVAYASSLDQVGVFGRRTADCATLLQTIAGHDFKDSTSIQQPLPDFSANLETDIKGLKIGVPKEYFEEGLDPQVCDAVKAAIDKLVSLGAQACEVSLPHSQYAVAVYYIIASAEASSNLSRYDGVRYGYRASNPSDLQDLYCRSRSEAFGIEVQRRILMGTFVLSSGYFEAYYLRAQKVRTLIAEDFKRVFENDCDLIACPTAPTTAYLLGEKVQNPLQMYLGDVYTLPASLAGLPGLSLPCGFDSQRLPIGLQLIGRPWDEATLFKVAQAYENATAWKTHAPNLG
ncbi:MAG: Asp-tRNA(Asn)/Glu-tRNA(Gln) amidotransferase subunit GatA [Deltaproteobacteria bacterium]|nr:Asp-tRNA(Asn)/Glu-tRNA(Gln) amidotransferase subunit GatA [Deltaproteobacteria bacterium]